VFTDDVSLCSSTPEGLQYLIDCFCVNCTESGLMVNPTKCEVVVSLRDQPGLVGPAQLDPAVGWCLPPCRRLVPPALPWL
jgi:hypothetical protein